MVSGRVTEEIEVKVPATEAWKLYGGLELAKVVREALPNLISKIEVVHGAGAVGTVLHLFFAPGIQGGLTSYKEKFTVVDDETRVKETEVVEGGYLDLGFSLYRVRFEVMEKQENECIIRTTIEYELKDELKEAYATAAAQLVSIQPLLHVMQASAEYLLQNHHQ